jgi:hypothetical protein
MKKYPNMLHPELETFNNIICSSYEWDFDKHGLMFPETSGVYQIIFSNNMVYIGKTNNLKFAIMGHLLKVSFDNIPKLLWQKNAFDNIEKDAHKLRIILREPHKKEQIEDLKSKIIKLCIDEFEIQNIYNTKIYEYGDK